MQIDGDYYIRQLNPFAIKPRFCLHGGYEINSEGNGSVFFSGEYSRNRRFSVLGHAGYMPFMPKGVHYGSYYSYLLGLEGRFYYALRSKEACSGFFVGPSIGYNVYGYDYHPIRQSAGRISWPHIGVSTGYQLSLWKHLRLSGSLILAYPKEVLVEGYNQYGDPIYRLRFRTYFVGYIRASVGYMF